MTDEERKARKREQARAYAAKRRASMTADDKEKQKAYLRAYQEANKQKIKTQRASHYQDNKEALKAKQRAYGESNRLQQRTSQKAYRDRNADKIASSKRCYAENNRQAICLRQKEWWARLSLRDRFLMEIRKQIRREEDVAFRLKLQLRTRLSQAMKRGSKCGSAVTDLGCTIEELKLHLEERFQPGMSWDNYGLNGWHMDHVKPLASFDLTDRAQFLEACHYTNLQPLWAADNLRKGASL